MALFALINSSNSLALLSRLLVKQDVGIYSLIFVLVMSLTLSIITGNISLSISSRTFDTFSKIVSFISLNYSSNNITLLVLDFPFTIFKKYHNITNKLKNEVKR